MIDSSNRRTTPPANGSAAAAEAVANKPSRSEDDIDQPTAEEAIPPAALLRKALLLLHQPSSQRISEATRHKIANHLIERTTALPYLKTYIEEIVCELRRTPTTAKPPSATEEPPDAPATLSVGRKRKQPADGFGGEDVQAAPVEPHEPHGGRPEPPGGRFESMARGQP